MVGMSSEPEPADAARPATHQVVVNHEEQYSIWPLDEPLPQGWRAEGTKGTAGECLNHIEKIWTDMRPLSIRGGSEEK